MSCTAASSHPPETAPQPQTSWSTAPSCQNTEPCSCLNHASCHPQAIALLPCRTASPGKLGGFEDELFRNTEMQDVPLVMAVMLATREGHRTVGIAYCDASARKLGMCEIADDEHFCNLEAVGCAAGGQGMCSGQGEPLSDWCMLPDL